MGFTTRHRRRTDDSDEEIDEEQFLQPRREESSQMSRQSSLKSRSLQNSQESQESVFCYEESQQSHTSRKSRRHHNESHGSLGSVELVESQESVIITGESQLPNPYKYLFRPKQEDNVFVLDHNSPVARSIGVVCVVQRPASDNNAMIKAHTLQKSFYSFPKNSEEKIKKAIDDRIDNDVANFKLQGYQIDAYTFGLPFDVEEICNISLGYDGKTKSLKASRNKRKQDDEDVACVASSSSSKTNMADEKGKTKKARK